MDGKLVKEEEKTLFWTIEMLTDEMSEILRFLNVSRGAVRTKNLETSGKWNTEEVNWFLK